MSVICTGSVAYDYLMSFPGVFKEHIIPERLESISLSFLVDTMVRQRGGTAPNIAYTLALLGGQPKLLATVGQDFGDYRAWLEAQGVDTQGVRVIEEMFTASFFANTDRTNAQISSFYAGAMAKAGELSIHDLKAGPKDLVIISPNDPGAMIKYAAECREADVPYLYDPSQQIVRMDGQDLAVGVKGAQSLFVNDYEFELLQKHTGLSAEEILASVKFAVVTRGAKGADVFVDGGCISVPAVPVNSILDPTGVGDAFRGGFVRGLQLGLGWEVCAQMGSLAAAYCLETRGPQEHHYTPAEFVARFRKSFDDQGALDVLINVG